MKGVSLWLTVANNGAITGTPENSNVGENAFTVMVTDTRGKHHTATMTIDVANIYSGTQGIEDLRGLASNWLLKDCTDTPACNGADLDDDQDVDLADFAKIAENWLSM